MNKTNIPKKKTLVKKILAAKKIVSTMRGISFQFQHISREHNKPADQLSKKALKDQSNGEVPQEEVDSEAVVCPDQIIGMTKSKEPKGKQCTICNQVTSNPEVECGGCS
jgi:hypothetical protein